MTALVCATIHLIWVQAPQLHGRILARARRCQGRASRFPAAAFAARPLTAPSVPARLLQPCK